MGPRYITPATSAPARQPAGSRLLLPAGGKQSAPAPAIGFAFTFKQLEQVVSSAPQHPWAAPAKTYNLLLGAGARVGLGWAGLGDLRAAGFRLVRWQHSQRARQIIHQKQLPTPMTTNRVGASQLIGKFVFIGAV